MSNQSAPFAVISGATNGIGYELAKLFAKDGYNLLITSRGSKLEEKKVEFESYGVTVETHVADLATDEGCDSLYQAMVANGRVPDAVAINAGIGLGGKFVGGTTLEDEFNLVRLNCLSVVYLTKKLLPDFIERNSGKILITSSVSGTTPIPFEAVYGASKAFVNSFFYAVRNEIQTTGVQMTLLLPGATETNFFHNAGQDDTKVGAADKLDPANVAYDGYRALMSGHYLAYGGGEQVEYEVEVLNRNESEPQKAQRHRLVSEPGTAE